MNIKAIRKQLGYTQTEFAREVHIDLPIINKLERYLIRPTPKMRQKIKDFCDANNIDFIDSGDSNAAYHIAAMYEGF